MERYYNNVNLILGLMDDEVRRAVKSSLNGAGFKPITEVKTIASIAKAASENSVDLLICDLNLEDAARKMTRLSLVAEDISKRMADSRYGPRQGVVRQNEGIGGTCATWRNCRKAFASQY